MDKKLAALVSKLESAHPDRLVSVVLYGSAAGHEHHDKYSDLNIFCVLKQITPEALAASEPVFKWWREQGNPSPLLMSEEEVVSSTDCFPIEFHDMQERRKVLYGRDVIAGLEIDRSFYRAQVEHEFRSKLIRLRQKASAVLADPKALLNLMLDSVSSFIVLARHALLLSGAQLEWRRRDVIAKLPGIGIDPSPFATLLDVREQKTQPANVQPGKLFENYLKQIEAAVHFVDRLEK